MSTLPKTKDLAKYPYEVTIEACPSELLKSVQSLKQMGMTSTVFEMSFRTVNELEIFARILNRQEDEERVANELKVTYFHNVRGKIKRTEMVKNQEFSTMKKIKFNSAYHVTLFLKYFQDRIKQLENEYRYTITNGREGYLYVYLNDDENISSMFVNEVRDMKKRLNFQEIKEYELCKRFKYSEKVGEQLKRIGLFHEIWYRGKESTMIFYSEKQSLTKMKNLIHEVTRYHITILKMTDHRFPFLINYFLFQQLKKTFWPEVRKFESVEPHQVEFNENKVAVVLHDMHEVFTAEIKNDLLEKMKSFVLLTYRSKFARGYFNWLKKHFYFDESLNFSYSKKTVCMCINLEKVKSYNEIKRLFSTIGDSLNFRSQITFNWLHLQDYSLSDYRKELALRIISTLSSSAIYVENYEKLALNKDLKCVMKLKNATIDSQSVSEIVSDIMVKCIAVWNSKELVGKNLKVRQIEEKPEVVEFDQNVINDDEQEDTDSDQSHYDDAEGQLVKNQNQQNAENDNAETNTQQRSQNQKQIPLPPVQQIQYEPILRGFQQKNKFTETLMAYATEADVRYFEPDSPDEMEWKVAKSWRKAEEDVLDETKIYSRVKKVHLSTDLKPKYDSVLKKIKQAPESTILVFYNFVSYSPLMHESPFYKSNQEERIYTFDDFKTGQKFVICCEMEEEKSILSFPICSFEIVKKF